MIRHLPTIASLRAFEATARHLSFTRAALELNLTQTAISHQIKKLEELIGYRLFIRAGNSVSLTENAHEYLISVRSIISELSVATDRAIDQQSGNVVTVASLGTFAIKTLIPNLARFRALHPDIVLRVKILQPADNVRRLGYDLAIKYGGGNWLGEDAQKIADETVFPVCSPALLAGGKLNSPADLVRHTVIRTGSPLLLGDDWPLWLEAAGLPQLAFADELSFDLLYPAFQAALEGLGVVMGRSAVVGKDIDEGRLVEPFAIRLASTYAYYVVMPRERAELAHVRAFRDWLLSDIGAELDRQTRMHAASSS